MISDLQVLLISGTILSPVLRGLPALWICVDIFRNSDVSLDSGWFWSELANFWISREVLLVDIF
jgi:hypothetical protein